MRIEKALSAAEQWASIAVDDFGSVAIQITGTFAGTVSFEATTNGRDFAALSLAAVVGGASASSATAPGQWTGNCAGRAIVRARMSAYTSGEAVVTIGAVAVGGSAGSSGGGGGGGEVTVADGADAALGVTTDAKVQGDNAGTVSAKLRGLNTTQTAHTTLFGAVDEAAPASDTASSGLNGRLQRIAQRLTTAIASLVTLATETTLSALAGDIGDSADPEAAGDGSLIAILKRIRTLLGSATPAGTNVVGGVRNAGNQNATWTESHFPAANTQATKTKAAAGASVKNVCTGYTVSLASTGAAPSAVQLSWSLVDDPGGTPVTLDGGIITLPAVAGALTVIKCGKCWIEGTANKSMTISISGAGGANTIQSVVMQGTTI